MPRGPLPDPNRRRRNAPTIPSTALPAAGRSGAPPKVPSFVTLERTGKAWWRAAWATPQAAKWDAGAIFVVARRASLEDDLAAMAEVESLDCIDIADAETDERVKTVIRRLAALAAGRLQVFKEMRELDRALGLTPKALADLRWTIVEDEQVGEEEDQKPASVTRLRAVDPRAVAGS